MALALTETAVQPLVLTSEEDIAFQYEARRSCESYDTSDRIYEG